MNYMSWGIHIKVTLQSLHNKTLLPIFSICIGYLGKMRLDQDPLSVTQKKLMMKSTMFHAGLDLDFLSKLLSYK